jgi:hypothetical protein
MSPAAKTLLVCLTLAAPALTQDVAVDLDQSHSELRPFLERYATDWYALNRRHRVPLSPARRQRMKRFYTGWLDAVDALPFEQVSHDAKIDWLLFRNVLTDEVRRLDEKARRFAEAEPLLPFWKTIVDLAEARRRMEPVDPQKAAAALDAIQATVEELAGKVGKVETTPTIAQRAARHVDALRRALRGWFRYRDGYDPLFSWWVRKPHAEADGALDRYAKAIRQHLVEGVDDKTLVGDPIGREALLGELAREMIPYTPEELVEIANKEFAWCDAEMDKASKALGFDDWRKAQDHVKSLHVEPGKQPELIRDLAREAIAFLDKRELVTIPALCREIWRIEMMSPERQKTTPYFTGGETITVAFPTDGMSHGDKLMSLRGNNIHFAHATVHHELIPGHHLQGFMTARHRTHRRAFGTPFWLEGWALYWEMLLWDLDFARSPEDRVGMLFWRKHRCARIVFSLNFHLKKMTAPEAVEFLIERVGHERNNAEAEVRRSVGGAYGPLYQAAYMLGGLQLRALHKELVTSGKMTNRAFHDAVLEQNSIPIEMVRAALTKQELRRDFRPRWRFYDTINR